MPHVQYWARVRAGMDCPLRRGASRGRSCRSCRSAPPCGRSSGADPTTRPPRPPPTRIRSTPSARAAASAVRWSTPRPRCAVAAAARCPRSPGRIHPGVLSRCCRADRRAERWRAPARWRCARSPRRSACEREGQIGKDASERLAVTPLFEAKIPWLPTCHGLVVRLPQPRACTMCIRARAFPGTPLAPTHAGPGVRCQSEGPVTSS